LAAALDGFDEDAVAETLLDLLGGDGERRQWAAQVARRLGRAEDTGILVTLVHDPEPEVRAVAAMGLASLVAAREGGQVALTGLLQCLRDPGAVVPYHAASVLAGSPMRSSEAADALASMRTHISARVRSIAVGADSSYAAYDEHPISEEDGWGDLESFRQAAGSS
jgi:HEAT repeat protein